MKTCDRSYIILALILSVVLSSCVVPNTQTPIPDTPHPTETELATETSVPDTPTPTVTDVWPTFTATLTDTPTATASPTNTYTPSLIPTETEWPTPTQIVTLKTLTPTPPVTLTPILTFTPTETPTATATIDKRPTQNPLTPPAPTRPVDNRIQNGGFEGDLHTVDRPEINVFESWWPVYCDTPYTPERCPALRLCEEGQTVGCNPPDLKMRRPEYAPIYARDYDYRVHSGESAQKSFCFFGACIMGVYQTFPTALGETCEVGAYMQSWSNSDGDLPSELDTQDERDNSELFILVDPFGGTFAFDLANLPASDPLLASSNGFGYDYGIYDQYVLVTFEFVAQSDSATVFFLDRRLFPIGNNDLYIDDAFAYCR